VIDRPVHRLAEWTRAELPYGQPTDADLALAARIGRDGTNRVQLDWLHDGRLRVSCRAWIGVIALERAELHVVPKLAGGNLGVLQMIDYASGLGALDRIGGMRELDASGTNLVDLVCLLLVEETDAVLRRGLLRDYVTREDTLGVLRGRLLVEAQVQRRHGRVDLLECRFDEHESDVLENQLLLTALTMARRLTGVDRVRAAAGRLAMAFTEVCRPMSATTGDAARRLVYHRRNAHYRTAHSWALLLLDRLGFDDLYARGSTRSIAFLLDMNQLFEDFATKLLAEHLKPAGWQVLSQHPTRSIILNEDDRTSFASIRPDAVLIAPDGTRMPVDAKYKRYDEYRVNIQDVYQAFLYAFAHAAPTRQPSSFLIYPGALSTPGFRLIFQNAAKNVPDVRPTRIEGLPLDIGHVLGSPNDRGRAIDRVCQPLFRSLEG
jgi:5-methylcytosine-specific restriction enzyme subunit McrC